MGHQAGPQDERRSTERSRQLASSNPPEPLTPSVRIVPITPHRARLAGYPQPLWTDPRTSGPGFGLTVHPDALRLPYSWRTPRLVFVNSMSDLFHARVPLAFIRQVLQVMQETPQHTYQVLTKRSRRLLRLDVEWPPNLWMGVSVENARVLGRVDDLRQVPAAVRFLSCEPLLGPLEGINLSGIHWVIAGGESGPRARPMDPQWVADLRDVCQEAAVPFFFKQWGGRTPKAGGRVLDGQTYDEMPERLAISA
jgi:protein gp37